MTLLLHPGYFPNIANFAAIVQNDICWEVMDNFQKQTYRNRCYICTDLGKHMLNIPIKHVGNRKGKQRYSDMKIDNDYPWQRQHWRTLETAYRTSPFFEFYEDDIAPLYHNNFHSLMDFNLKTIETVCECLQIKMPQDRTEVFEVDVTDKIDGRILINSKANFQFQQPEYVQVFEDRNDFIPNLSILDLLFNEGTNTLNYLKNLNINLTNA
ncbi:WbqC-like protein family protein [Arenibacter palladensis]|uniref:WbqC-like protein family protein n=1 Tax=Arenibacter palladensis TaxID=237373 RepID=A0A1M5BIL3_9FLAO|nr:WbqC family protein [Arenibacter palladensis]SHF42331.1 WbqC-like protein family protein [Arenibacter palladensis]